MNITDRGHGIHVDVFVSHFYLAYQKILRNLKPGKGILIWRKWGAWGWEQRKPGLGSLMRTDSNVKPKWTEKIPLECETSKGRLRTNEPYFPDFYLLALEFNM